MKRPHSLVILLLLAPTLAGCLRRSVALTSDPPGAVVRINDEEVGRTPVNAEFKYYGAYDVRVRKEGYEPIATSERLWTPWYEFPPLDFFANLTPVRSEFERHYDLDPKAPLTEQQQEALTQRARDLRATATGEDAPRPID